ncbi:MAG: hypothetical protein JAZ11_03005 [Candidatus Thiodiazotropha lotti]|nr:hypothetical protein [Candidatus Thiodiazotropha lotti]
MLRKLHQHCKQSRRVHHLLHESLTAPTMNEKLDRLRQVNEINKEFDPKALPKWMAKTADWYVANLEPALFPFGSPYSNLMLRLRRVIRHR